VIELAEVMQGPLAAQVLGDYGAEVIKVERGDGDILRRLDRDAEASGLMCPYFAAINRNKRSVSLNLKDARGLEALHKLLETADVVIHSYRPDGVRRLGLAYHQIQDRYPRLVYGSASGWGESGPLSHKAGQDLLAQAMSGLARAVASPDNFSYFNPTASVDFASGMSLAQGILAALFEREHSGLGQQVSISLLDAAVSMQTMEAATIQMYGRDLNWVQQWYSGVFKTQDGAVAVLGLFRENALALVCSALELPDLSGQPEFATTAQQAANREGLNRLLAPTIGALTTEDALGRFDSVDLLSSPVLSLREALEHPQVERNGRLVDVVIPGQGPVRLVGNPVGLSRNDSPLHHTVPLPGQDTDAVLAQIGYNQRSIDALRASGVIR
jgi:crotonobetainyl-CoA:carnitine CoA-transferase CaiB-like acyl-CoA transferase